MVMQRVTWFAPAGWEVELHNAGRDDALSVVERGCTGLDMPPTTVESIDALGVPGAHRVGAKINEREMAVPLLLRADSETALDEQWSRLLLAFNPDAGAGHLRIVSPGADRLIKASYVGGLEGDESFETSGVWWRKALVKLRAHDPFWKDSSPREVTFQLGQQYPFFPLQVGDGKLLRLNVDATFGTYYAPSMGDMPTYPSWQIDGPFDGFTLRNGAGEQYQYGRRFPAGVSLLVNFDPMQPDIAVTTPPSAYSHLQYDVWDGTVWPSELWAIREGSARTVMVDMRGATTASRAVMTWRRRWSSWRNIPVVLPPIIRQVG